MKSAEDYTQDLLERVQADRAELIGKAAAHLRGTLRRSRRHRAERRLQSRASPPRALLG